MWRRRWARRPVIVFAPAKGTCDMDDLFKLSMPWWIFVLRAVVVYLVILAFVRLSGKRTVGQFTAFDTILLVLIGTAVQNSLIGDDISLLGGLILAATLISLNYAVAAITAHSRKAAEFIEGAPVLLARDGEIYDTVLRREQVSKEDFAEACRRAGCRGDDEIELALLETHGNITVMRRESR
jgi:uncharacterized membrane protein YcaP (DUF421 family)